MNLFRRKKKAPATENKRFWHDVKTVSKREPLIKEIQWSMPTVAGTTMDNSLSTSFNRKGMVAGGMPELQADWYLSQGFIGYPLMAFIAKHWLVDKACGMPARDSIRQGYKVDCDHADVIKALTKLDRKHNINKLMREHIQTGRRFGGSAALFLVESTDPDYYVNPFNPDGVTPGSYKGIKVIDPMHMHPVVDSGNVQDPASPHYMRPTYWRIGGSDYHYTHFVMFIPYPVADIAKPTYNYFGVSVPERIYERVYAAERTANEAPELAMTKRLGTAEVPDLEEADIDGMYEQFEALQAFRDNFGTMILPAGSNYTQHETALADLDTTIMTQYQLVAAGANVPATKLLGTTPKGFNATGEYEEGIYREELESIQANDLDPLLVRHYEMLARSEGLGAHEVSIQWEALDSPTAKEFAEINNLKAQTAVAYQQTGAIDGEDIRNALKVDVDSDYFGLKEAEFVDEEEDNPNQEAAELGGEPEEGDTGGLTA